MLNLSRMPRGKSDPGQILRAFDPANTCWGRLAGEIEESRDMTVSDPASCQSELRLPNYLKRIANQCDAGQSQSLRELHCMDQGSPLSVAVRAMAQIVKNMNNTAHHHCDLDPPRIWATAAVKEHFQAPQFDPGFRKIWGRSAACSAVRQLAERQGFEPWVPSRVRRISSAVHSTTLPPLREVPKPKLKTLARSKARG